MQIVFDVNKNESNFAKHGFYLSDVANMDLLVVLEDERKDYGELRYRAWGYVGEDACSLAFTVMGEGVRPISLRRAHEKEMRKYVKKREK